MQASFQEPEDLLAEEGFYKWYLKSDPLAVAQWDNWIKQSLANEMLANEAILLLQQLRVQEGVVSAERVEAAYRKFADSLPAATAAPAKVVGMRRRWWMAAAAAVLLVVTGTGLLKYTGFFKPSVETQYGQIKEQRLPDGSEVTLNAHSKISYSNNWTEDCDREVWINGEAFFHVKKTPHKSRFIVHTGRFDVIVTGTRFNVINRDGITNVLLQEGSVTVRTKDGREIYMKPGDFVDVNDNSMGKKSADAGAIVAWKDRKMVFDNTPLAEAAHMIENHYGVQVTISDSSTAAKTLNGILPNDNLDVLLSAIESALDVKVERNGNTIVIKNTHKS